MSPSSSSLDPSLPYCEVIPCYLGMWCLLGVRWAPAPFWGSVLPLWNCFTNPLHHLSALHLQGDSSFVVMTNFIMTPQQAQGHCAEVRTSPFSWTHRGENIMESPWALVVMWDEFSDYGYNVMFDRASYKITLRH